MPMKMCASCSKMISISAIPGGNPQAREHPEMFAMYYAECERCGKPYCDGCVNQAGGTCPDCGKKVVLQGPPPGDAVEMPKDMRRMPDAAEGSSVGLDDLLDAMGKPQSNLDRILGQLVGESQEPVQRPGRAESGGSNFPRFIKLVTVVAVIVGALYGVGQVTSPGSMINDIAGFGFNLVSLVALVIVLSPVVGALFTAICAVILIKILDRQTLVDFGKLWMFAYLAGLVCSPWLIYQSIYVWALSGWQTAYLFGAVLGAFLGAIANLANVMSKLRD